MRLAGRGQPARPRRADLRGRPEHAEARHQAHRRLLEGELGLVGRDRHVARERQLGAAAVGDAVDRGDHDRLRPLDRVEAVEHHPQVAAVGVHVREVVERVDVPAGAERPARAGQHARADLGVGVERVQRARQLLRRTPRPSRSACRHGRSSRSPCRPRVAGRRTRCDTTNCLVEALGMRLRESRAPAGRSATTPRRAYGRPRTVTRGEVPSRYGNPVCCGTRARTGTRSARAMRAKRYVYENRPRVESAPCVVCDAGIRRSLARC